MSHPVIISENLSKHYRLAHKKSASYSTFRETIVEKSKSIFRNKKDNGSSTEDFRALDDISFEINDGDRVGIIGRNGAGKSTLLKILSRIVSPTKGQVTIEGRVASLLEVGTGFHPELTGRENIFLNGSILGMSRSEIQRKFDEIVAFSEVEKFLDTPVKRYSSGMYVRLAFAVAAHLEPEILIVDEVLAVGDAQFQQKCLGKMEDVSRNHGRTVLFVSHNMQAIQKLCNSGLLLRHGKIAAHGNMSDVINAYIQSPDDNKLSYEIPLPENHKEINGYAYKLQIEDSKGKPANEIAVGSDWQVRVSFRLNKRTDHFVIAMGIVTAYDLALQTSWSEKGDFEAGDYEVVFRNKGIMLTTGQYRLVVGLSSHQRAFHYTENAAKLKISEAGFIDSNHRVLNTSSGLILNPMEITITKS